MEYLKHFITEEIYLVPDTRKQVENPAMPLKDQYKDHTNTALEKDPAVQEKQAEKKPVESKSPENIYTVSAVCNNLDPEEEKLLAAILTAIKTPDHEIQRVGTIGEATGKNILIFDSQASNLYKVENLNGKNILAADNLKLINKDVNKKKMLWAGLKQIFTL